MNRDLLLVDSSAFIEYSRGRDTDVADAVEAAVSRRCAAVCQVVAAELLAGCNTKAEWRDMQLLVATLAWLPVTDECWTRAAALGFNLRRKGIMIPLPDRLVAVTARVHGAQLLHCDAHFDAIGDTPDSV